MFLQLDLLLAQLNFRVEKLLQNSSRAALAALTLAFCYGIALAVAKVLPVNDALTLGLVLLLVFGCLHHCTPRTRTIALHLATQMIVLTWVLHLWTLGYEGRNAVFGGILPWSDSRDYYEDALRLLHGNHLDFGAKRPIFPVAFAALLRIFGGDLRAVLLAFAMLGAFAVALATLAVWRTHGRISALLLYLLLLFSARQWSGFVQTEDVGLPLGLIGFTLIWNVAADGWNAKATMRVAAGLFAITMALMARAGAFFVLPALVAWSVFRLSPSGLRPRLRILGIASLAIVAGIAVHEIALCLAAKGASFSDYPAIVFGLIHHRDFTYLAETHPAIVTLTGAAKAAEAWRIVMADVVAHPFMLVFGLLRSFLELFVTPNGLLGFVWRNPDDFVLENKAIVHAAIAQYGVLGPVRLWLSARGLYSLCNAVVMGAMAGAFVAATIAAIVALYRGKPDRFGMLLRFAVAGVLLSAPFTPPWITSSHQVQTATLAFFVVVPAIWRRKAGMERVSAGGALPLAPAVFGAFVLVSAVLLTAFPIWTPDCRHGCNAMKIIPSTAVRVVARRSMSVRELAKDDLRFSIPYLARHNRELTNSIVPHLKEGAVFVFAYHPVRSRMMLLIDDNGRLDRMGEWVVVAGRPLASPTIIHVTKSRRTALPELES